MSNLAGVTKDMFPEGTVATSEGLLGPHGEVLLGVEVTQAEMNEFNGTSSDLPKTGGTTTSSASPKKHKKVKAKKKKTVIQKMKSAFK